MAKISERGRAGLASSMGTAIEWYDFFIYGTAAGLVFNQLFFPAFDPLVGTLLAFASFSSAFVARPIGGVVFGHFGDRLGRKAMLVLTLTIMGVTTLIIGLLPSYDTIGVGAPILLVLLRFVQGLSLGGEYGGAILMAVEHAPPNRRGLFGSFVQMGVPAGLILGNGVFLLFAGMSDEAFLAWGWRVPFLIGGLFVFVALVVRLSVRESPDFSDVKGEDRVVKLPLATVLREYRKRVVLTGGVYLAIGVTFYITTVFGLSYGTQQLGLDRTAVLSLVLVTMLVTFLSLPLFGLLSDRIGRKPVFSVGIIVMGVSVFPWFWLFGTGSYPLIMLGYLLITTGFAAAFGPLAAMLAELFETRIRYTGISIGYTLGTMASSALAPVVATWLLGVTGTYTPIGWYMMGMIALSLVALCFLPETFRSDFSHARRGADDGHTEQRAG